MDNYQLIESIRNFSLDDGPLGNQGYSRVLLQLFGYTGHGKSSFINYCKYVINNEEHFKKYVTVAGVAGITRMGAAVTVRRQAYELTKNISIVDNRGFFYMTTFERAEIYAQLGGFFPINEEVNWSNKFVDMMKRLENAALKPNYSDFIVPILVYSIEMLLDNNYKEVKEFMKNCVTITGGIFPIDEEVEWSNNLIDMMKKLEDAALNPNYTDFIVPILVYSIGMLLDNNSEKMKEFMKNCVTITGIVPIVVLTNKSKGDFIEFEREFKLMGAEHVISIENYTEEDQIKTEGRNRDILRIIHKALTNVKFCLEQERNLQKDWDQRKRFLLGCIYEAELERGEEGWRRQQAMMEFEEKRREEDMRFPKERRTKHRKEKKKKSCLIA